MSGYVVTSERVSEVQEAASKVFNDMVAPALVALGISANRVRFTAETFTNSRSVVMLWVRFQFKRGEAPRTDARVLQRAIDIFGDREQVLDRIRKATRYAAEEALAVTRGTSFAKW